MYYFYNDVKMDIPFTNSQLASFKLTTLFNGSSKSTKKSVVKLNGVLELVP